MRTWAAILLTLGSVPALAADPEPAASAAPFKLPPLFEGWTAKGLDFFQNESERMAAAGRPTQARSFAPASGEVCFFIRQTNRNLKPPSDRPRLIPLAAEVTSGVYAPDPDCLPRTVIRKAVRE